MAGELGEKYGAIFEAHLQMLQDARLRRELEEMIRHRHYSPEYAVSRTLRRYAQVFQRLESAHLAERANDIFDIEKRLLRHLLGRRREGIAHLTSPVLVLAHNLTPSETANLDRRFVRGFVTEVGGPGGHTAIVAEALEIPAVVGTGPFLAEVSGGDTGDHRRRQGAGDPPARRRDAGPLPPRGRGESAPWPPGWSRSAICPAKRPTASRIRLFGNIEFPYEVQHCLDRGADGVGLYRTEFLYLGSETEPTEETHFQAYRQVVAGHGRPAGDHPHLRPRRRQGPPPAAAGGRAQPLPRPAEHPPGAAAPGDVSHPVAGGPAGQRPGKPADHVPPGLHAAGTPPGENGRSPT